MPSRRRSFSFAPPRTRPFLPEAPAGFRAYAAIVEVHVAYGGRPASRGQRIGARAGHRPVRHRLVPLLRRRRGACDAAPQPVAGSGSGNHGSSRERVAGSGRRIHVPYSRPAQALAGSGLHRRACPFGAYRGDGPRGGAPVGKARVHGRLRRQSGRGQTGPRRATHLAQAETRWRSRVPHLRNREESRGGHHARDRPDDQYRAGAADETGDRDQDQAHCLHGRQCARARQFVSGRGIQLLVRP